MKADIIGVFDSQMDVFATSARCARRRRDRST
jgi:hypothetical protein